MQEDAGPRLYFELHETLPHKWRKREEKKREKKEKKWKATWVKNQRPFQ